MEGSLEPMRCIGRVVMASLPFWLCLAASLGATTTACASSLPSSPKKDSDSSILRETQVWRLLNSSARSTGQEPDDLPSEIVFPEVDYSSGPVGQSTPSSSSPQLPAPQKLPGQLGFEVLPPSANGGSRSGSAGVNGQNPPGLLATIPASLRPSATRIPIERAILRLTERPQRVFRPPRSRS
jgi:hypothetical protein